MKKIVITLVLATITILGFGQHTLKGTVVDESNQPLQSSTVVLLDPADNTLKYFGVTNSEGKFQIKSIKKGSYTIQFSFVGKETISYPITIPYKKGEDLGITTLVASMLEEAVIKAEIVPMKFDSDTVEYNTKAFKTRPGARAEELISRLPGVEVDENGNIQSQGEDVTKVLVDGKEFFGNDPKVATKNLPAEAIDKVQVYDKKTEEAEFSGIEDGVRYKTINLVLNEKHKSGYFGNLEVGAGIDPDSPTDVDALKYNAEGKLFRFSSKSQAAILGLANNINAFGLSHKGNNTYGQGVKGLNESYAGGTNLSYSTDQYNRYFISYLINSNTRNLTQNSESENFMENDTYFQDNTIIEKETNTPHNFDLGVRHNFNKQNRLVINGGLSISHNLVDQENSTNTFLDENTAINAFTTNSNDTEDEIHFDASLSYISKFNDGKTQFVLKSDASYQDQASELIYINDNTIFDPYRFLTETINRDNDLNTQSYTIKPTVVQKLNEYWTIDLGAGYTLRTESLDRYEEILEQTTLTDNQFETEQTDISPFLALSRQNTKTYISFALNSSFRSFDKKWDQPEQESEKYFYLLPSIRYRSNYKTGRKIEFRYSTSANMPGVSQLFPIVNNTNPSALYQGNLDLEPEYRHSTNLKWSIFDQFSFTSFFLQLRANYTDTPISTSQTINEDYVKIINPINVDNAQNVTLSSNYSTPIRPLAIEITFKLNEGWSNNSSFINGEENITSAFTHRLGLSFQNRNRDKWRINIGGTGSMTDSDFSISTLKDNTIYSYTYNLNIGYTPTKKWNFELKGDVSNFSSQSFDENIMIPLLRAEVSYFFLEAERASLTLSGFDLLNKAQGFQQISQANYISRTEWNTLSQYFMLSFKWQLGR